MLFANLLTILLLFPATMTNENPVTQPDLTAGYRAAADRIIEAATADHHAWNRLAHLTDYYPHRLGGSQMLEDALDWSVKTLSEDGISKVWTQDVPVPHWVRGREHARVLHPVPKELPMLGLGGSVGTGGEPIIAEVLIVGSFQELEDRADEADGRIVVWNVPFTDYGATVQYRGRGAVEAAKAGALASLIRSVTPFSMQTPHTGGLRYHPDVPRIPGAAITPEDAEWIQRMVNRGETVELELYMEAETLPDAMSRNVIAEIPGSEFPEEIVVIGCHIDSWDVGHGAMDDAGGCIVTWEALRLIHQLDLKPKRTIRLVLFTNEENGIRGALDYRDMVIENGEIGNHVLALEVDFGVFDPRGFGFSGSDEAFTILEQITSLLEPVGASTLREGTAGTVDVGPLGREGVPIMGLDVDTERYFWYHHTEADRMEIIDADELARCVAAVTVMAYVVADMPDRLPR
jgi:carboxypeptidase Q